MLQTNVEPKEDLTSPNHSFPYKSIMFVSASIAMYALIRKGNYRAALLFYPKSGGGGLNFYKQKENGQFKRLFAVDYHPFWDAQSKETTWKLHYHRGENLNQLKKHRPYQGGW